MKAECPLCKKAFTSIIHNVKSNSEYDQHILPVQMEDAVNRANVQYAPFLQTPPPAHSRHQFHFRYVLKSEKSKNILCLYYFMVISIIGLQFLHLSPLVVVFPFTNTYLVYFYCLYCKICL